MNSDILHVTTSYCTLVGTIQQTVWAETCSIITSSNITKVCLKGTLSTKSFKNYRAFSELTYNEFIIRHCRVNSPL